MRKLTLAIATLAAALIGSSDVFAQGKFGPDSAECVKYLSYYKEYYKQKAYEEATPNWRKAYAICPATASQNMLIEGAVLMRQLIAKNQNNPEYKNALVDTLLTLHDTRAQYYPKYAVTARNNKGIDLANYVRNDFQKQFDGFEGIIESNKEETRPNILLFDMQAAINLYQAGSLDAEKVIATYQRNAELLDDMPAEDDAEKEQNQNIKNDMGNLFAASKVASCENLLELFTPRFEANPNDLEVATNIVQTMALTEGCTDNDLYLNAVTTMNDLDPSATSAYYLFKLHGDRGNTEEAIRYMESAIAAEDSDAATDAEWEYELAVFCYKNGQNARAFEAATIVTETSEELKGKALFLIGNIWGSSVCGTNEIEKRAPYWVACDYMNRAKQADPSLEEEANNYIRQYSVYFPEAAEAFMYDLTDGQSYTVICNGMRATTTVRTTK